MGSLLIFFLFLLVGSALGVQHTWRSAHSLRDQSVAELRDLKTELASRHLIILHLLDSLPPSFDPAFNREKCAEARRAAVDTLEAIDVESPESGEIAAMSDHEETIHWMTDELTKQIESNESVRSIQPVAACVDGLKDANRKIGHALSTYNASAITYANYLQRPTSALVARWLPKGAFDLFDINLVSVDSRNHKA